MHPNKNQKILDLGGGDGSHIAKILPAQRDNIYIADINKNQLAIAENKYGFKTIELNENAVLPIEDNFFDIVFCSSVIEHVTGIKNEVYNIQSDETFTRLAKINQKKFAKEIQRIGKHYFVQTPNKYFIIECHSRLPFIINFIPRKHQIKIIRFFNQFWIKKTSPDWYLLSEKDMKNLFPESKIIFEKFFFMKKSLMAIK